MTQGGSAREASQGNIENGYTPGAVPTRPSFDTLRTNGLQSCADRNNRLVTTWVVGMVVMAIGNAIAIAVMVTITALTIMVTISSIRGFAISIGSIVSNAAG